MESKFSDLDVVLSALELPDDEQLPELQRAAAGNPTRLAALQALLSKYQQLDQALQVPAINQVSATTVWRDVSVRQEIAPWIRHSEKQSLIGTIDGYEVLSVLGRGGCGIVLKARDPQLDRVVAIKVLRPHLSGTATVRQRFLREVKALAKLNHPNVVRVLHFSEVRNHDDQLPLPYFVMEHIDGESLQDYVERVGPLPPLSVRRLALQILNGLGAAHELKITHRDIKPANILLESPESEEVSRVLITDFGIAQAADDAAITETGAVLGTPLYMAPEQARSGTTNAASDLFSLGSVLYFLAAGVPPFRGENRAEVLTNVMQRPARKLQDREPALPEWLCRPIERLMQKSPSRRFRSAAEVAEYFAECLQLDTTTCVPERGNIRSRLAWLTRRHSATAVLMAMLGFLVYVLLPYFAGVHSPDVPADTVAAEFRPMFNGNTLDGWEARRSESIDWLNLNGTVSGHNASDSTNSAGQLRSMQLYRDFHFRCEVLAGSGRDTILMFRAADLLTPGQVRGYALVEPPAADRSDPDGWGYGSLYADRFQLSAKDSRLVASQVTTTGIEDGDWYQVDFIASGNHVELKINGQTTATHRSNDPALNRGGSISLRCAASATLQIRNAEIRELNLLRESSAQDSTAQDSSSQPLKAHPSIVGRWKLIPTRDPEFEILFHMLPDGEVEVSLPPASLEYARRTSKPIPPSTSRGRWQMHADESYVVTFFDDNAVMEVIVEGSRFTAVNAIGDPATAMRLPDQ